MEENAISTSSAILGTTLDALGLEADSQRCHRSGYKTQRVEFHNALEIRHGYGSQTPHSP